MTPVRLHRKEENSSSVNKFSQLVMEKIEAWVNAHALLCLIILTCLLMAIFVAVIFAITGVSATESGAMRNFMNGGYV